jgi:hypothetical protein
MSRAVTDHSTHANSAAETFEEALRLLAGNLPLQARFFNTLSMLEYIGARKILKSQSEEGMSLTLLTHAAEELRHAKALKGLSERLGGTSRTGYATQETLAGSDARTYFQTLDDRVADEVGAEAPRLAYLYETLLIEERALLAYPALMKALWSPWVEAVGRGILAEEDRHMEEIQRALASDDAGHAARLGRLRAAEETLFAEFARALVEACRAGIQPATSASHAAA